MWWSRRELYSWHHMRCVSRGHAVRVNLGYSLYVMRGHVLNLSLSAVNLLPRPVVSDSDEKEVVRPQTEGQLLSYSFNVCETKRHRVWLDVPERVKYKLATMVYNCLHGKAPSYLTDCCTPISDVASRRHLRSASRRQLLVPRHNLSTYGHRAFSVAGPAAWNCLCDELSEPLLTANSFRQLLKTRLFAEY